MTKAESVKDFLGSELAVGDEVVFTTSNTDGFTKGYVCGTREIDNYLLVDYGEKWPAHVFGSSVIKVMKETQ